MLKLSKSYLALAHALKAPIATVALAMGGLGPLPLPAQTSPPASVASQLPTLGDGSEMTSSAERRLGDRIVREIYRDPDYIDDPVLVEYVQGIWQPLLAAARLRGDLPPELDERFAWEVMLVRNRAVNAFALPGGYMGVHLGLIAVVSSRDELASVLGHELSHVTQRHISRLVAKQEQQSPWMIGAMILGMLAASKNADVGNALIVGGQAVAVQNQLNFSRDMEREADRVGFGVMTAAGFEAQGFVSMFDKLQQAARLNDSGAYPYLRSHPLTTERIADMQSRLTLGASSAVHAEPPPEHAMITARARVLSDPGVDALRAWQTEANGGSLATLSVSRQAAVLYGAALAASSLREASQAGEGYLDRLARLVRADANAARLVRLLAVEVALKTGDAARAAAALKAPAQRRPELFLEAQLALQVGHANDAAQRLQLWVAAHPRDAQAWQLLSSAYAAQGQTLRAVRASAETQVALLNYEAALDRLRAGQELVRQTRTGNAAANHIDASIIDTRRRQVELLMKEQALER